MNQQPQERAPYEPPVLVELGSLQELTQARIHCTQKLHGHSDGLHFGSHHIVCTSH
jgi:hypothetical protein